MNQEVQQNCEEVYFTGSKEDPTSRELRINRSGKIYLIGVTTPDFLERLKEYNKSFDSSSKLGENFYIVDFPLPSAKELCQRFSQIPTEVLKPYLIEQTVS